MHQKIALKNWLFICGILLPISHFQLQTKTLQDAPRDPDKLREILKEKQKEYEKAEASEDIEDLVTEIEMLKYVLFLVGKYGRNSSSFS